MATTFTINTVPKTYSGINSYQSIIPVVKTYGMHHVLITGASSFKISDQWKEMQMKLKSNGMSISIYSIKNEPSPKNIDEIVKENAGMKPGTVIAIGGGSVIDAGKAVSAMLPLDEPVKNYLEGVGTKQHPGVKVPFFAIPTTAGTGSEATKNAVISEPGNNGFKKSLRHDNFIPDLAVLDPSLHASCPRSVTAASGMDAITQLIESYVSTEANIFTDSLCTEALKLAFKALPKVIDEPENMDARGKMAYAAYISGITLTNAGLGTVHGFASSIGGAFEIPHGVVCGTLLAETTRMTIEQLQHESDAQQFLRKYANVGRWFSGKTSLQDDEACEALINGLNKWTNEFEIPRLGSFDINEKYFPTVVDKTGQKNNPVLLTGNNLFKILKNRL